MLNLRPVVNRDFCRLYVLQTFARWRYGVARSVYAEVWLKETGPLEPAESEAMERLKRALIEGDGCAMMRIRGKPIFELFGLLT